jgi:CcmD family protein
VSEYVVLAVTLIIFVGLWLYLWNLDAQVARLKKEIDEERRADD